MADTTRNIAIRLSLKDGEVVKRALMALGDDGQKALARIEKQSQPASRGLLAVNAVVKDLRAGMVAYAGPLGAVGSGMMALGTGGLVAAAAIGGLIFALKGSMQAARDAVRQLDALDQRSKQLGVGVEALQEYRYAFGQTGVDADLLEKSLQGLGRRIGEIANFGKGEAKDALDQMGISVINAAGRVKTLDDLLPEVADGLSRVTDQNRRMSLAQKLFDSEGVAMVRLLQQGSAELARMRAEAREMGAVLDAHLVEQASEANRKLETMQRIIDTQLRGALISLAPLLIDLAKAWADVARWIGEVADNWRDIENRTSAGLERRLAEINEALKEARRPDWFPTGPDDWAEGPARSELESERARIAAELERRRIEAEKAKQAGQGLAETSKAVADRIKDLMAERDGLRVLANTYDMNDRAVRQLTASTKADDEIRKLKIDRDSREAQIIAGLVKGNAELAHSIDVLNKARAMSPDRVYAERLAELEEIRKTGLVDEQTMARETEKAERTRLDASTSAADGIKRALMDIREASQDTASQWETDIGSMNSAARSGFQDIATRADSLSGALQGLLNSIERTIAGRAYDATIGGFVNSALDSFFPSPVKHGGGMAGASGPTRMVSPRTFIGAPRFHDGYLGLRPGEVTAILERRERVLTEAQQDNTARSIEGLARLAAANTAGGGIVVKPVVYVKASGVTARTQTMWSGDELRIETFVEEIESRMGRNIQRGEGLAPVIEQRYGANPAAGAVR